MSEKQEVKGYDFYVKGQGYIVLNRPWIVFVFVDLIIENNKLIIKRKKGSGIM